MTPRLHDRSHQARELDAIALGIVRVAARRAEEETVAASGPISAMTAPAVADIDAHVRRACARLSRADLVLLAARLGALTLVTADRATVTARLDEFEAAVSEARS